jgi:carboxymethylenebutenolidase
VATQIEVSDIEIETPDGRMPAVSCIPEGGGRNPAVLVLMEAFGVTPHIRDVAERIAREGYVVVVPDLYYRERADHTFGYDEVQQAMEAMYRLDFGKPMEAD